MFKICARTVLELGSELISSDDIAFYELIKNAFDAGSPIGAEIRFEIVLRRRDYERFNRILDERHTDIGRVKSDIEKSIYVTAPQASLDRVRKMVESATDAVSLSEVLDKVYYNENQIIVSDEGSGMSKQALIDNYLVIGTSSRKRAIETALERKALDGRPPYLGEKGIGRLSAMRLGDKLTVETAEKTDARLNRLEIDWTAFADLDAMLDDIGVAPTDGGEKPDPRWSGTRISIGALAADWTHKRVQQLGEEDFARLTDPFRDPRQRPRIALFWNGTRIPIVTMDRILLRHAHASISGRFTFDECTPSLECIFNAFDVGIEHPPKQEKQRHEGHDLHGAISGLSEDIPSSALDTLGPFEFEAYWFNRQRLGRKDTIGDRKVVQELQKRWSGIMLFRDGFRVMPYGRESDDWLELDRRALASTGYLLNKAQFVGRVQVSRIANGALVDQTNREGLRVCPEQRALVAMLQFSIRHLRVFLKDVQRRHQDEPVDIVVAADTEVPNLMNRARRAIQGIREQGPEVASVADDLQGMFTEIRSYFERLRLRAEEIEKENREMIHMAGVGLMVEVVAHELARSSENALSAIEDLRRKQLPEQIRRLLESLGAEMRAISKRIRVLDPLSVSGRQRREVFDLTGLLDSTLEVHQQQFKRHGIKIRVHKPERPIRIRAVKGMIVQILENLISNSTYWLDLRRRDDRGFRPVITICITDDPLIIAYKDNGRGIAKEYREKVFRPFFSLKEPSKRRGIGLFIARECARYHDGKLHLDDQTIDDNGRIHRFILELPDKVSV